jgi:DNA-binding XRE family transcriptional regulator
MNHLSALACLLPLFGSSIGKAASVAPPDLAGLIACKKDIKDWTRFGMAYDPANTRAWGWRESKVGTGFLQVFELRKPIEVFGEKTSTIALSGTSVVALLKGKSLEQLVTALKLEPAFEGSTTRIFTRKISSTTALSVSTSAAYPGFVLAGCSYQVEP